MNLQHTRNEAVYRDAMGQLLVLYTPRHPGAS